MGCDFAQLNHAIAADEEALLALKRENCGVTDDVGACIKERAAAIAQLRAHLDSLQYQLRMCSMLVGTWQMLATAPDGTHLPGWSGNLWIRSWDPATHAVDAALTVGGRQAFLLYPTFDPGDFELDLYASLDGVKIDVIYIGHLAPDPNWPATNWPTGRGFLEPIGTGNWSVSKVFKVVFNPGLFARDWDPGIMQFEQLAGSGS